MPNWFYTDDFGFQQGPVSDAQLKKLATQGMISPDTLLETDAGKKGKAGQIKGLFPAAPDPLASSTEPPPLFNDTEMAAMQVERVSSSPQQPLQTGGEESFWMKFYRKHTANGKYAWQMIVILVILPIVFLFFFLTTASLEGTWVQNHDPDAPKTVELFKDGTGTWDGHKITWRTESQKRGRRSYDYFLHFQFTDIRMRGRGGTVGYNIVFSTLTLMFEDGNVKYTKQKGGAAAEDDVAVKDETVKDENVQQQNPVTPPAARTPLQPNPEEAERRRQEQEQQRLEREKRMQQQREEHERRMQEARQRQEQMQREAEQRRLEMQQRMRQGN